MTQTNPSRMSAILNPDPRLTKWDQETGQFDAGGTKEAELGQASPRAGLAELSAGTSTPLALRVTGEQQADLSVLCNRAGLPVLDGAGYLTRLSGGGPDGWMGCDLPVPLGGFQSVSGANPRYQAHVIATGTELTDTAAMCVFADIAGAIYSQNTSDAGSWTAEVQIDGSATTNPYPCLLRLPDTGRVLCFRWGTDGTAHTIRAWYTDDDGATWTAIGPVLSSTINATTYPTRLRLRVVYVPASGVICMMGHLQTGAVAAGVWRDRIVQWASSDGGYTFEQVTISDGTTAEQTGGFVDLCVWRGEIVMARLVWDSATAGVEIRVRRLASGWVPWTSADELAATGGDAWGTLLGAPTTGGAGDFYLSEGELALWADDDTALYLTGRHCIGAHDGASPVMRSPDGGATWNAPGSSLLYAGRGQAWMWTGSIFEEARGITACSVFGHGLVVHTVTRTGAATNLLYATWLGGWQDAPMPAVNQSIQPTRRIAWHHVGTAAQLPDECGWALVTVGATPTITLGAGYLYHQMDAGESATYTITPAGTLLEGIIDEHAVKVISGQCNVRLRLQDAVPKDYDATVRITPTTIILWDNNAGAQVGSTLTYTDGPVAVRLDMASSSIRVLARTPGELALLGSSGELCGQARDWDEVAKTATLTAGGGAANNLIEWQTTASSEAYWFWWPHCSDAYCGDHQYSQTTAQRFPRSMVETPSSGISSTRLSSVSGPGSVGDQWSIEASGHYPYDAVLPGHSPSPRHPWRSTISPTQLGATGPTGRMSWQVNTVAEHSMGALWGTLIDGMSMGGVEVWLYYGAAWHQAETVGYWAFTATVYGKTLEVSSGGATFSAILRRDELAGCLVDVLDNASTESLEQHTVVRNDPGHINTAAGASLPLRIELQDAPVTATPIKIRIYPRRALLLHDMSLYSQQIRGIQIRWPIPRHLLGNPTPLPGPSPLGYHEIATVAQGPVWVLGRRHDWGRRLATDVDTEILTAEDGTRTAFQRAPARRRMSATYATGVDLSDVFTAQAPHVIGFGAGKPPLAFLHSAPIDLADILRRKAGAAGLICWLEAIDSGGTGRPDHWADGAFLGRITGAIERDLVVGDEERSAAERVQDLTVEEEL
jgi:hypothetical protein